MILAQILTIVFNPYKHYYLILIMVIMQRYMPIIFQKVKSHRYLAVGAPLAAVLRWATTRVASTDEDLLIFKNIRYRQGFTLIEIMITIVLVAILASIALPSYQAYVERARRIAVQTTLQETANRLERYYTEQKTYADVSLESLGIASNTSDKSYRIQLSGLSADTYIVTAIPLGAQEKDSCGALSINQLGQKKADRQDCW